MRLIRLLTLAALLVTAGSAFADDFPLRAKFPGVQPISLSELEAQFRDVVVVDVRSKLEYDTMHVAGAVHLPLKDQGFPTEAKALQTAKGGKAMVFYCNGIDCPKSYDAVAMCQKAGMDNTRVFDLGIFEWAKARPEQTVLLGRQPADPAKLISKETLKAHLVPYAVAREKAATGMAIDVREPMLRSFIPDLPRLRNIPMDDLIPMLAQGKFKDQNLVLIDNVGKQVQWLQYWLEDKGYTNYVFVEHGAEGAKQAAAH